MRLHVSCTSKHLGLAKLWWITVELDPSEDKDLGRAVLGDFGPVVLGLLRWKVEHRAECCSADSIDRLGLEPRRGLAWQVRPVTPCVSTQKHNHYCHQKHYNTNTDAASVLYSCKLRILWAKTMSCGIRKTPKDHRSCSLQTLTSIWRIWASLSWLQCSNHLLDVFADF